MDSHSIDYVVSECNQPGPPAPGISCICEREEKSMPSKSKEARLEQMTYFEKKLDDRLSLLAEQGLDSKQITRDSAVKKLRAQIRKTNDRLKVIQDLQTKSDEMARLKAEKLAAPKKEKEAKKKSQEEEAQVSKRQKKKMAKKEEKEAKTEQED